MKGLLLGIGGTMLVSPIVGISIIAGASGGETGAAAVAIAACNTSGPLHGLTNIQARNARVIVAAAQQYLIDDAQPPAAQARAELIALMAADVESTLHDYANPNVPASEDLPNDGDPPGGGDHDSVGLFQQRANWGPLSSRMNPVRSTRRFLARVVETSAWSTQPPGIVAQAVQGSAYPDRYAARQSAAQAVLAQIETSPELALCGSDGLPLSKTGSVPAGAIPAGYTIPRSATDAERRAITFALAQLGKPYVYGATGPDDYDCSGLVLAAWAAADVSLPHYTLAQYKLGTPVPSVGLMSPGDLIFIPGSDGTLFPPNPQHVGMYLGHGYVIEAPQTGDVVKIVPTDDFGPIVGIRHYG